MIMNKGILLKKQTYLGLFTVTLATLMYEILLTRIFSVTMWYHFAFVAISIAMFGMTVGAILVYLFPHYFTQEQVKYHLALSSLLFGITIVLSFLIYLIIPFKPFVLHGSILRLCPFVLIYAVISVPFVFSGICVSIALTKFPSKVNKLYAADLAGAAVGCILLIYTLNITDGPTAVIVIAFLSSIGSVFFTMDGDFSKLKRIAIIFSILFFFVAAFHTVMVWKQFPLIRLKYVKGGIESRPIYEKWNSFSRIKVEGDLNIPLKPFGWGLSSAYTSDRKVRRLYMNIDANAATFLTGFDGNLNDLEFLKYDIVNLVHYSRSDANVLVIGTGGGRDILSALVFEQKSVLGIEINKDIIDAVNQKFGDFTGHLDKNPKVTFVNDEARSYIARLKDKFDIIQVSLIDTWAATAAGAFVLTENSLYTVEAWEIFLKHLTPSGILTFSRWFHRDTPGQIYRLTSLASSSLIQLGVKNPRKHIIILKHTKQDAPAGIGTILISKEPFSDRNLDIIEKIAFKMQFEMVLSPRFSLDSTFATIASGENLNMFLKKFPINITAPTDDSPFFFNMLRIKTLFKREILKNQLININMQAVFVLVALLITVILLIFLCIIVPLILTTNKGTLRGALPLFIFFAAIGFGFMLVEISQMQRLIIFLGHPTYSLSVVLFSLLLSSGFGSYLTQKVGNPISTNSANLLLFLLLCSLLIFGILTPYAINAFQGSITTVRISVAIGTLFPIGLFMGMAFPIGMKMASTRSASLTPWLWGINGATSVCASVLAVVISLSFGISKTFWTGFSCYIVAFIIPLLTRLKKLSLQ